jgi:CRP/FNR family cyclic AMP-dependent transcriptional regulator
MDGGDEPVTIGLTERVAVFSLPASASILELWYPLIEDDPRQQVLDLAWDLELPVRLLHDPEHGNPILYLRCPRPGRLCFTVSYLLRVHSPPPPPPSAASPDLLCQATDMLFEARRRPAPERPEALIRLCRRSGLSARLVSGLRVLVGSSGAGIAVAHHWAEVFVPPRGWLPADPGCDGTPVGAIGADHVVRSRGRQILLQPFQHGRRLPNLFAPYAEADGHRVPVESRIRSTLQAPPSRPMPTPPRDVAAALVDPDELARLHPPPRRLVLDSGTSLPAAPLPVWLYLVTRGKLRLVRLTTSGHRLELDSIAAPGLFTSERLRGGVAEVAEPCQVCLLTRSHLEQLSVRRPSLAIELAAALSRRLGEAEERLEYLAYHSVADRLALALLRRRRSEDGRLEATHQELGDMVGASRETVTKLLHRLQRRGAIRVRPRCVQVIDPEALAALLEG